MTDLNVNLKSELLALGYRVEQQGCMLKVKLGGLATPVYIEHDIAKNRFIVNTQDLRNGVSYGSLFFLAQISLSGPAQALLFSMTAIGGFTIVLTELKAQALKQQVALFNQINIP
ncbi:hypothetical protein ACVBIL_00975 [Shewanella sp. 125m-7]